MSEMVLYDGRMVARDSFCAFVYGVNNKTKLVKSYTDYEAAISSGIWFENKDKIPKIEDNEIIQEDKPIKRKGRPPRN